jgi:hypothetical protein
MRLLCITAAYGLGYHAPNLESSDDMGRVTSRGNTGQALLTSF